MYGKFFASTFTGSMVGAGADVFAVWGYVVANTCASQVELNPKLLATIIGITQKRVVTAISYLCAPDPDSRNKIEDGRRLIQEGQFIYRVPSHEVYRTLRDETDRREYMRRYIKDYRLSGKDKSRPLVNNGKLGKPRLAHTEAEAEAEAEANIGNGHVETDLKLEGDEPKRPADEFGNPIPAGFNTPEFREVLGEWHAYKRERREVYKPLGAKQCLGKLVAMGSPEVAVRAMKDAMGSNYQGFFKPRNERSGDQEAPRNAI